MVLKLEMKEIINQLPHINKRMLTSATQSIEVPGFVRLDQPTTVNYFKEKVVSKLEIKTVVIRLKTNYQRLLDFIGHLGNQTWHYIL